jgi:hypothetical protein
MSQFVRLILDGTVERVRLDREATSISLLVVMRVCAHSQKVLLAVKSMGGESTEAGAQCSTISSSVACAGPNSSSIDGASGLENAIAVVWDAVPVQRCTLHEDSIARACTQASA